MSHWTDISLSALRNQSVKKQLSAKGRQATQTTWSEKENALVPCALNRGASHHPGSGVEFQQPFLDAYYVPHDPSSCSSLKLVEENLPSCKPLCQSYVCECVPCCMHACVCTGHVGMFSGNNLLMSSRAIIPRISCTSYKKYQLNDTSF